MTQDKEHLSFCFTANIELLYAQGEMPSHLTPQNPRHAVASGLQDVTELAKFFFNGNIRLIYLYAAKSLAHFFFFYLCIKRIFRIMHNVRSLCRKYAIF